MPKKHIYRRSIAKTQSKSRQVHISVTVRHIRTKFGLQMKNIKPIPVHAWCGSGARFKKILKTNLGKTYDKIWLKKS